MIGKNEMVLLVRAWRQEYNDALTEHGTETGSHEDRFAVDKIDFYLSQMEGMLW